MPPTVASVLFAIGILGLFYLDRDENARLSKALWIPAVWLFMISSRGVSLWLGMAPSLDSPEAYLEGSPIDRAVFTSLLIAGLAVVISRMERVGPLLRKNGPILLFFAFCAVSTLWSDFPFVAFRRWTKSVGDLVMVLIILTEPDPMGALKRLLTRLGFLLFPLSVLLNRYYPSLGRTLTNSWTMETTGIAMQKNSLGVVCLIFGLGFLWQFLKHYQIKGDPQRGRHLLAQGVILAMMMWLLWMSNSLTSLSSFLLAGGLMVITARTRAGRIPMNVHLLVVAVVCLPLSALFLDSSGLVVELMGRDPTFTGRTEIWHQLLGIVRNPVFGTGFQSFWLGDRVQAMWDNNP